MAFVIVTVMHAIEIKQPWSVVSLFFNLFLSFGYDLILNTTMEGYIMTIEELVFNISWSNDMS